MEILSWFTFDFVLIFTLYYILFIRKAKRGVKTPSEVQYLINLYKLDTKKFSYKKFLVFVGLVTSFDTSLVATIVTVVDGIVWQILFGFIIVIPVMVISFTILGKYYKNKETKDNSKELEREKKYLEILKVKESKKENKKAKKSQKGKKKHD